MNIVLIIPTGIGCEIGGHAGDATPVAKLLGSVCDNLILHPNVVNASDINEMPNNALYVEGSMLDRFLNAEIGLAKPRLNRVLVAVNPPVKNETINAVSAARVTIGMEAKIVELNVPLELKATMGIDGASGYVSGWKELITQISPLFAQFDALAIASPIEVDKDVALKYLQNGGINPWGAVEAKASRLISNHLNKPVAHAPVDTGLLRDFSEVVDPRMAPEMVSVCYIHCVLKGLHKAPRIGNWLTVKDVDYLISPMSCYGNPHKACDNAGVPIIYVRENKPSTSQALPENAIIADNYLEVAGMIAAANSGILPESVRRPAAATVVIAPPYEE